ncbi:putative pentatricopeptide repeat-containing protein At1g10330 [Aristolochia californica]|uniref:putative pentatricopeptide repeat-containing protein At1g10330 n=1 Tax=Aristolochia californica TaxID=171875 RepID=UPI0035D778C5
MLSLQILPNGHTFPSVVQAAASWCPFIVKSVHAQVIRRGLTYDCVTNSCLLKFYAGIGELSNAHKMFQEIPNRDIVSFNSMLDAFGKNGDPTSVLSLFDQMPDRDIISWTSTINGLVRNQFFRDALNVFEKMIHDAVAPNEATLVSILSCFANSDEEAAFSQGKQVHACIIRKANPVTPFLGTGLIDMYGKNGHLNYATKVFDQMPVRECCTWNAIISALASNGREQEAILMFEKMQESGPTPNSITYVNVLTACSRAGLVSLGPLYFESMQDKFGIEPRMEHYGCMVDMMGRAGLVREAIEFIRRMPVEADGSVWGALLGACKTYGETELGEEVGKKLMELQPSHSGRYMVFSNLYAQAERWPEAAELRQDMSRNQVQKVTGLSKMLFDV